MQDKVIRIINDYLDNSRGEDSPSTKYISQQLCLPLSETKQLLEGLADESKVKVQMCIPDNTPTISVECWRTLPSKPKQPVEDNVDYNNSEEEYVGD